MPFMYHTVVTETTSNTVEEQAPGSISDHSSSEEYESGSDEETVLFDI